MRWLVLFVFAGFAVRCRERYDKPYPTPVTGYLVVDGFISYGDSTVISLSRTTQLAEQEIVPEADAAVTVQGEDGTSFPLFANGAGAYASAALPLNSGMRYRVNIITVDGKQYQSDYSEVHVTPPIDSLSWTRPNGDVEIFLNAHDESNGTLYYKWDYIETWEFHSTFFTSLKYSYTLDPNGIRQYFVEYYDPDNHTYNTAIKTCWRTEPSTSILLGSTARLSSDVAFKPIKTIAKGGQRISVLYSILAKQRALSLACYNFYERMRKNSETLGSIFDAQPSESKGNIHNLADPAEPVIGFVEAASSTTKRIFISNAEVPGWNYDPQCSEYQPIDTAEIYPFPNVPDVVQQAAEGKGVLPTEPVRTMFGAIISFRAAPVRCVDCTILGTNQKPLFWP